MYTQLIRHLERRPDKYSLGGKKNIQTLLLLDEFARFGKLDMITNAMSTLRSKNVNICLIIQSIAQLDKLYGEYDRRIILDNCQYQAILRANDPETQKYFSELIGTTKGIQRSIGNTLDKSMKTVGYSRHVNEALELRIQPHELSTLQDILLLTPYGFCRAEKSQPGQGALEQMCLPVPIVIPAKAHKTTATDELPNKNESIPFKVLTPVESEALMRRCQYVNACRESQEG